MKSTYNKILKIVFIVGLTIYAICTFINQQNTLNQYAKNCEQLKIEIAEQKEYKEQLLKKKDDIQSEKFIEETAREKLDMYLPNEKVYMDAGF